MITLDDTNARHHTLSIRLAPDGFSFFIRNDIKQKVISFRKSPVDIHQDAMTIALAELKSETVFSLPFKEVNVLIDFTSVTTVPTPLFSEDKTEKLFALNADAGPNEFIISNSCKVYDLEVLFAIPKELYRFFSDNFPKVRFVHQLTNCLNLAYKFKEKTREQLYISYSGHHMVAVALRNNMLIYHNYFNLISDEDFIYYLLLVFQELKFDQYDASVLIDGAIDKDHKAIAVIKEYVKHINFASSPSELHLTDELLRTPEHFHANLLALPHCE